MMRILVATDGSPHALRAAQLALRFVQELKQAEVIVINVGHIPDTAIGAAGVPGMSVDLGSLIEGLEQAGLQILDQTAEVFTDVDVPVRRDYRTGNPAAEIIAGAREHKAELIVMDARVFALWPAPLATRGRSGCIEALPNKSCFPERSAKRPVLLSNEQALLRLPHLGTCPRSLSVT